MLRSGVVLHHHFLQLIKSVTSDTDIKIQANTFSVYTETHEDYQRLLLTKCPTILTNLLIGLPDVCVIQPV